MRSFRTSAVVATAAVALTFSGLSRAEDAASKKDTTTQGHGSTHGTTQGQGTTTTPSTGTSGSGGTGSGTGNTSGADTTGSGSSSDVNTPSTTPSTSTDTTWGTGSDTATGAQGSHYTTMPGDTSQHYQQAQQQAQVPQTTQQTTTYSTTTTTAGNYNANYNPNAGAEHDGWIHRPNRPLLYTGLGILVGTYATSVVVGASSDKDVDKRLYIPVVGPWLDLGQRDCGIGDCDATEDRNQALLIGSGVLQGVGTLLTLGSFIAREENVSPPSASSKKATSTAAAKPTINVTPMSYRGGGGFGAIGTF